MAKKVSTRWPTCCHVTHNVHVAELKETAQVPLPTGNILNSGTTDRANYIPQSSYEATSSTARKFYKVKLNECVSKGLHSLAVIWCIRLELG